MIELLEQESQRKIEDCIEEAEKKTSAEIVVAIARKSGEYRDVCYLAGMILSLLSLSIIIFSPFPVHMHMVVPDVIIFFFIGYFLASRFPGLILLLTSSRRRDAQVRLAASVAFHDEKITATKDRTGILIYFSILEKQIEILTDIGIDGKVPRARWNHLRHEIHHILRGKKSVDELIKCVCSSGEILAEVLPATGDNVNEIPNRPRIRD